MVSNPQAPPHGSSSRQDDVPELEITVGLDERSYPIRIASGVNLADSIRGIVPDMTQALVVHDESVAERWASPLVEAMSRKGLQVESMSIPSGETSKSVEQLAGLWNWMLQSGGDRRSVVIAVGGGVVGDLAGFAAATFTRGIRLIQVPTTLLSMVDSSVGGKTGINLPGAKNMVGSFWQPSGVVIDTETLSTLPDRSFLSGLAEVVKYGVIDDPDFFEWLEQNVAKLVQRDATALRHAIRLSCESKARVVEQDERETSGRRAILNYGHTFAHAIEATAGYGTVLHGEAVSMGMQMAARLAIRLKMVQEELLIRQTNLLQACQLPITFDGATGETMLPVMMRDKKVAHGKLRFVLPTGLGSVKLVGDVDAKDVLQAIQQTRS